MWFKINWNFNKKLRRQSWIWADFKLDLKLGISICWLNDAVVSSRHLPNSRTAQPNYSANFDAQSTDTINIERVKKIRKGRNTTWTKTRSCERNATEKQFPKLFRTSISTSKTKLLTKKKKLLNSGSWSFKFLMIMDGWFKRHSSVQIQPYSKS